MFDLSGHYQWAFTIGTGGAVVAFVMAILLKPKYKPVGE
jgi:hypothetical protein